MIVNGNVELHISLNVYDLETEAVYTDAHGAIKVDDPDKFFEDWCDHWVKGIGELSGASVQYEDLESDDEDDKED